MGSLCRTHCGDRTRRAAHLFRRSQKVCSGFKGTRDGTTSPATAISEYNYQSWLAGSKARDLLKWVQSGGILAVGEENGQTGGMKDFRTFRVQRTAKYNEGFPVAKLKWHSRLNGVFTSFFTEQACAICRYNGCAWPLEYREGAGPSLTALPIFHPLALASSAPTQHTEFSRWNLPAFLRAGACSDLNCPQPAFPGLTLFHPETHPSRARAQHTFPGKTKNERQIWEIKPQNINSLGRPKLGVRFSWSKYRHHLVKFNTFFNNNPH